MIFILLVLALVAQLGLGYMSTKRGYGYSQFQNLIATGATILLTAIFAEKFIHNLDLWLLIAATCILINIFFIDYNHYIIPNGHVISLIVLSVAFVYANSVQLSMTFDLIRGGLFLAGFFLILKLIVPKQVGMGDVKMSFPMGMFLGGSLFLNYVVILFISAALISIVLVITRIKNQKDRIPFGPFMVVAFLYFFLT